MSAALKPVTERERLVLAAVSEVLRTEFAVLRQEIADAQTRTLADCWRGDWLPKQPYLRGMLVRHRGDQWLAIDDTSNEPGSGSGWRLFMKGAR